MSCEKVVLYYNVGFLPPHMQLYELDSDPNRKEFLDDLFTFMQKRGEAMHFFDSLTVLFKAWKNMKS